jgi:hypothetical protein
MKQQTGNSHSGTVLPRCSYLSPSGRRCSLPICSSHPTRCFTHKPVVLSPDQLLAAELSKAAGELATPADVNRVLGKIFLALLEDRISLKKAGTLGFLGQMILRADREIAFHEIADRRSGKIPVIFDLPRPIRDDPAPDPQTSPDPAHPLTNTVSLTDPAHPSPAQTATPTANPSAPAAPDPQPSKTAPPPPPPKPVDYNHFFPFDPSLPPGSQDPRKNIPPPDEAELRRREYRRGFRPSRHGPMSKRWQGG